MIKVMMVMMEVVDNDDYVPPNFWQDASDNVQLHGKLSLRYHTMEHLKASLHKGP